MAAKVKMTGKRLYKKAIDWLKKNSPKAVKGNIDAYLLPNAGQRKFTSMNDLFERFLRSLTQAGGTKRMLEGALPNKSISDLSRVTFDFDPVKTAAAYKGNSAELLAAIKKTFKPKKAIRTTTRSVWPKYCETILSTAEFLSGFSGHEDFVSWVMEMAASEKTQAALPLIIQSEIRGCGFALACNFLIDMGVEGYAKPDRHVKKILSGIGIIGAKETDYRVLKVVQRLAAEAGITPYAMDKLLYVIGSGNCFLHGESVPSSGRTESFIAFAVAA